MDQCDVDETARVDCMPIGPTHANCRRAGCCSIPNPNAPHCFITNYEGIICPSFSLFNCSSGEFYAICLKKITCHKLYILHTGNLVLVIKKYIQ